MRQPSTCVSRVTTTASQPAASARRSSEALSSSEALQYSWNHREPAPIAAATSSIGRDAWFDST